jgi:hypothetical protein
VFGVEVIDYLQGKFQNSTRGWETFLSVIVDSGDLVISVHGNQSSNPYYTELTFSPACGFLLSKAIYAGSGETTTYVNEWTSSDSDGSGGFVPRRIYISRFISEAGQSRMTFEQDLLFTGMTINETLSADLFTLESLSMERRTRVLDARTPMTRNIPLVLSGLIPSITPRAEDLVNMKDMVKGLDELISPPSSSATPKRIGAPNAAGPPPTSRDVAVSIPKNSKPHTFRDGLLRYLLTSAIIALLVCCSVLAALKVRQRNTKIRG